MDQRHRDIIQSNILLLSKNVNLEPLYQELLDQQIVIARDIEDLRVRKSRTMQNLRIRNAKLILVFE